MNSQPHWLGLEGRVCVVTGAASGIGLATAQALAAAGAAVALIDRDGAAAREAARRIGSNAFGVACDIADEAASLSEFRRTVP